MKIKDLFNDFRYLKRKFIITYKVNKLNIHSSGLDQEGDPFVRMLDGLIFYGSRPKKKDRKFYNFLLPKIKEKLCFEGFQVACDIVIRYFGRGLKFKGPKKERFYEVQKGDVVVEIGAYRGYYTMYLSQIVGPKGNIIAIEPIKDNVRLLEKNVLRNNLNNITIVPKGVWKEEDTLTFYKKPTDDQSASIQLISETKEKIQMEVDSLDNILDSLGMNKIDFMIIQSNGAEYEALEGLTDFKPQNFSIAARYKKNGKPIVPWIIEYLYKKNYEIKIISNKYIYAKKRYY